MSAEELRQRRLALGLTQVRLALLLGTPGYALSRWETGRSPVPTWVEEKLREVEASRWPRRR